MENRCHYRCFSGHQCWPLPFCPPAYAGTVPLTLNCSSHCWFAEIFSAWLQSHNHSTHSSAKFSFPNGVIQSSLNSKERFALACRDSGSYCTCLLPNAFLEDKAQAVLELSYGRVTTAAGGHVRKGGEMLEETWGRTDCWGHRAGDTLLEGGTPLRDCGSCSPEGPQPGRNPSWSSDSEKSREEKTIKNCGRGADGNHYTVTHFNNHTRSCHLCPNPNLEEQSLGKAGTFISISLQCWAFLRKVELGPQWRSHLPAKRADTSSWGCVVSCQFMLRERAFENDQLELFCFLCPHQFSQAMSMPSDPGTLIQVG